MCVLTRYEEQQLQQKWKRFADYSTRCEGGVPPKNSKDYHRLGIAFLSYERYFELRDTEHGTKDL